MPADDWQEPPLTGADAVRAAKADRAKAQALEAAAARSEEAAYQALPAVRKKHLQDDAGRKMRKDLERERGIAGPERELRIITALRMRRRGASNREIANALGYKDTSSVTQLIGTALSGHQYEQHEIEVYRDYFLTQLLQQMETAAETIRRPGYLYDVKGDLVSDPDGQFLENISERTKAQTEWRHMQESARKLLGVDAPQKKIRKNTLIIKQVREVAAELGIDLDEDIVEAELVALTSGEENTADVEAE